MYAFDLLFEIYQEEGYFPEDIPALILQNNLFGMEIDGRAAEIAKFALEMKAREKDPDFFEKHIDANVTVLEPVAFEPGALADAGPIAGAADLLDAFEHMTEVGSLYVPAPGDMAAVDNAIASFSEDDLLGAGVLRKLRTMKNVLEALSRRVDCVVANPPYLGRKHFNGYVGEWTKEQYPDEKGNLCMCFIKRGFSLAVPAGYSSMVTIHSWMFLGSYEKMRSNLLLSKQIIGMAHLGKRAFEQIAGEVVQVTATILWNEKGSLAGDYIRLVKLGSAPEKNIALKEAASNHRSNLRYRISQDAFDTIPEMPIVYWLSDCCREAFAAGDLMHKYAVTRMGLTTGNNSHYLRLWFEVAYRGSGNKPIPFNSKKWIPYDKGGSFRRWYGNACYVVNWSNNGEEMATKLDPTGSRIWAHNFNGEFAFKEHITWSGVVTEGLSFRWFNNGYMFDAASATAFPRSSDDGKWLLGLANSTVCDTISDMLNPTTNFKLGDFDRLPIVALAFDDELSVAELVDFNIGICRKDWDAFEISWDFEWHPLAPSARERAEQLSYGVNSDARTASVSLISERFARWSADCDDRFNELKSNEEELNRIFARIYGMEGEVPIEVPDDKVSARRADLVRDVKSLISYGVGCIMGRYSIFAPGLILADAQQTVDDFRSKVPNAEFLPDEDAILPVLDGEWFGDDIVVQFRKWLEVTYGAETLDENIRFIEDALGKDLRKYFVKDFYKDHCATYQVTGSGKRPIYWMFASPKGSFQVLVYMHRYTPSTVGQILTKYLREYVEKLNAKIGQLEQSDRAADNRQADKYRAAVRELTDWERDVIYPLANERIDIDLDDGVKVNYNKFPHALAKVTGLSTWK